MVLSDTHKYYNTLNYNMYWITNEEYLKMSTEERKIAIKKACELSNDISCIVIY